MVRVPVVTEAEYVEVLVSTMPTTSLSRGWSTTFVPTATASPKYPPPVQLAVIPVDIVLNVEVATSKTPTSAL
jgi:hypothetical protein